MAENMAQCIPVKIVQASVLKQKSEWSQSSFATPLCLDKSDLCWWIVSMC